MTEPASTMVERIAQVIDPNAFATFSGPHWDGRKAYALAKAREILEAASEPTEAMTVAGEESGLWGPGVAIEPGDVDAGPVTCWRAMIAAALAEPQSPSSPHTASQLQRRISPRAKTDRI